MTGAGEDTSTFKDWALSLTGRMAALAHTVADDEILKNTFANYAFEHFEIAAYKSLLALAELGEIRTASLGLEANLAEEVAMAEWLDSNLRGVRCDSQRFLKLAKKQKYNSAEAA